jgi:hypothetical protein
MGVPQTLFGANCVGSSGKRSARERKRTTLLSENALFVIAVGLNLIARALAQPDNEIAAHPPSPVPDDGPGCRELIIPTLKGHFANITFW